MKAFTRPRLRALRSTFSAPFVLVSLVLAALVATPVAASATAAPSDGFVRLAHLSPDTPDVDVYLRSLTSNMKVKVFPGVGYGTVSAYLTLPAGTYSVAMRAAGAKEASPPVLSTDVRVLAGHAYTVAGVGRHADLGLKVIPDDLSNPLNGQAMVRIVQASIRAPLLDVAVQGGATIATSVPFATTTTYRTVAPGVLTLLVGPTGGTPIPLKVNLQPDSVYSVLVLDGKTALTAQLRTDAVSKGTPPSGGVATGGGGMSRRTLFMPTIYVAIGALALLLLVAFRRRGLDRWTTRRSTQKTRRLPSRSSATPRDWSVRRHRQPPRALGATRAAASGLAVVGVLAAGTAAADYAGVHTIGTRAAVAESWILPAQVSTAVAPTPSSSPPASPSASPPAMPVGGPTNLRIPAISVNTTLEPLTLNANGQLNTPAYTDAGWYAAGTAPGDMGPAVIAGHYDGQAAGDESVFYRLGTLKVGDPIQVKRNGTWITFTVDGVASYPQSNFPTGVVYGPTPYAELRLITCGGTYSSATKSYSENVVVFATEKT